MRNAGLEETQAGIKIAGRNINNRYADDTTLMAESKEDLLPMQEIRDASSIPGSRGSPGGRNGNPLQYSCLENSVDRGAWWATVHRVPKNAQHSENEDHGIQSHHSMGNRWGNSGNCVRLYFGGLQNHCRW